MGMSAICHSSHVGHTADSRSAVASANAKEAKARVIPAREIRRPPRLGTSPVSNSKICPGKATKLTPHENQRLKKSTRTGISASKQRCRLT